MGRSLVVPANLHAAAPPPGSRTWLHLDSINYRAEVWLNGQKVVGRIQAGATPKVAATIDHSSLDGSRVFVYWDGKPINSNVAFARQDNQQQLLSPVKADLPGVHELRVADRRVQVTVQPTSSSHGE